MFVAREACIERGGKLVRPVAPDKKVDPLAGFLMGEEMDFAVMHLAHRDPYLAVFRGDDLMLDRLFPAPAGKKEDNQQGREDR
jgi:hypothetical protein